MMVLMTPARARAYQRERQPESVDMAVTVTRAVIERRGIPLTVILGASRERDVSYTRHLLWWLLQVECGIHTAEISRLAQRHHTSVLDGIRRIELELRTRPETQADVAWVRRRIVSRVIGGQR